MSIYQTLQQTPYILSVSIFFLSNENGMMTQVAPAKDDSLSS